MSSYVCYECGFPASLMADRGAGTCHVCREFYCHQHYIIYKQRCDRCDLDPEWGQAHRAQIPPPSNIGCNIAITLFWLVPIVIFAIMLSLSQGATSTVIRDAGDPFSNGFFLALAGLATIGVLWMFVSLMKVARGFGKLVVLVVFGILAIVGVTLAFQAHQRYQDVSTSTSWVPPELARSNSLYPWIEIV